MAQWGCLLNSERPHRHQSELKPLHVVCFELFSLSFCSQLAVPMRPHLVTLSVFDRSLASRPPPAPNRKLTD